MFRKPLAETPPERARNYRDLASAAESNAAQTPLPALRNAWLRSADRWLELAALLEKAPVTRPEKSLRARAGGRRDQLSKESPPQGIAVTPPRNMLDRPRSLQGVH
jgi:hypothetical protein